LIQGALQGGAARRAHPNRSGKIQRPGPQSPGGPRVRRDCQRCGREFWPRVVDVERGHGRHCSTTCQAKVLRKKKHLACDGCGEPLFTFRARYCMRCSPLTCGSFVSVEPTVCVRCDRPFFRRANRPGTKLCGRNRCKHRAPLPRNTTGRHKRANGAGQLELVCPCGVAFQKGIIQIFPGRINYHSRACRRLGPRASLEVKCGLSACGRRVIETLWDFRQTHGAKCCCAEHSHKLARDRAAKYEIAGEYQTLSQLSAHAKLSKHTISKRIRAGMPVARAITEPSHKIGPHRSRFEFEVEGVRLSARGWAKRRGISYVMLLRRLKAGIAPDRALAMGRPERRRAG